MTPPKLHETAHLVLLSSSGEENSLTNDASFGVLSEMSTIWTHISKPTYTIFHNDQTKLHIVYMYNSETYTNRLLHFVMLFVAQKLQTTDVDIPQTFL